MSAERVHAGGIDTVQIGVSAAVDRERRRVYADLRCATQRGELVASATHLRALVD